MSEKSQVGQLVVHPGLSGVSFVGLLGVSRCLLPGFLRRYEFGGRQEAIGISQADERLGMPGVERQGPFEQFDGGLGTHRVPLVEMVPALSLLGFG